MIGNTCIVACYADLEMETCPIKSPSSADQRKYGSRRRRVKPRRFKPLLNCLNSLSTPRPPHVALKWIQIPTRVLFVQCGSMRGGVEGACVCDVSACKTGYFHGFNMIREQRTGPRSLQKLSSENFLTIYLFFSCCLIQMLEWEKYIYVQIAINVCKKKYSNLIKRLYV